MNRARVNSVTKLTRPRAITSAGFTLVELLVVMAVIGILSALLLTNFVGIRERAADASLKNDARQLKTALRLYYNDYQRYPVGLGGVINGCGSDGETACNGGVFSAGGVTYMKELPANFEYYSTGDDEFTIKIPLANASDESIAASQSRCDVANRSVGSVGTSDYFECED